VSRFALQIAKKAALGLSFTPEESEFLKNVGAGSSTEFETGSDSDDSDMETVIFDGSYQGGSSATSGVAVAEDATEHPEEQPDPAEHLEFTDGSDGSDGSDDLDDPEHDSDAMSIDSDMDDTPVAEQAQVPFSTGNHVDPSSARLLKTRPTSGPATAVRCSVVNLQKAREWLDKKFGEKDWRIRVSHA
jgi:hypothetical protein